MIGRHPVEDRLSAGSRVAVNRRRTPRVRPRPRASRGAPRSRSFVRRTARCRAAGSRAARAAVVGSLVEHVRLAPDRPCPRPRRARGSRRISANERVRDHFQALPPDDVEAAQSIEDVRRTIAIHRALVGAGQDEAASDLYERRLRTCSMDRIGADATVAELLGELDTDTTRWLLAIAHRRLGALRGLARDLSAACSAACSPMCSAPSPDVARLIRNIGIALRDSGSLLPARRCFALADRADAAAGLDANAVGVLQHAVLERVGGRVPEALALLATADSAAPSR